MESNISLIEVAGEDDSLLQQIPEDDLLNLDKDANGITAGNSDFFLCSPLVTDRSDGTVAASSTDYTDKENINANNLEGPKLSIMPQQMKRKKKAGGYNLRKSLAWNKAFFTEEGVLDSVELSMITGSTSTSCGEALGAIDEEIPEVPGGGCNNNLPLQDKLFKDTSTSTPSGDRKNGRCLLSKRGSSTKDNVKSKELSAKDVNRSGSNRGSCLRPVASSSAKRPTISNATKTVNKVERISKIPVPKRDPTVISRTPRKAATVSANDIKKNQVTQSQRAGINSKLTSLKGSSSNAKRALNKDVDASKSLKAKTSIQQPSRKLANPVLKKNSSHSQHDSTNSNEGLKATKNSLIAKPLPMNDDGTRKVPASIAQNAPPDGGSMLNQTQMPKPSGLRMPSPSMGFFGQKKVSSFQSLPPASELRDLSKSKIPNVRTAGPSNPIGQLATLVPRNFVKASNGEVSGETSVVSGLSSGSSVEPLSHDRVKSVLKAANIHLGKENVVGASSINKVLSVLRMEKPDVLSLSNPVLEHLGDVSRIHDEINDQLPECKSPRISFINNFGDPTISCLGGTNDMDSQGMPRVLNDRLNGAPDCYEQSSEQGELANSSSCIFERISPDHQRLEIGTRNSLKRSRTSKDFEHGRFEDVGNGSNGQEWWSFDKDEALETHKMRILRTEEAEASDIDHCISNECNNNMQSTSATSNSDLMHIDDDRPMAPMSNISLQGRGFSVTSQHYYTDGESEVLARGSNGVRENELRSEIDLCLIPQSTAEAYLDGGPVVRNCNDHTDEMVDIRSDIEQKNSTSLEMERKQDDHNDVAIVYNADAAETLLINQDLCSSDTEKQQNEAQICMGSEHVQNEEQNSNVLSSVNDFNVLPELDELQNCCMDLVDVSQNHHQGKCLNDDMLHANNSEEYKEEIIADSFIDSSNVCTSECFSNYSKMGSPKDYSSLHVETHDTRMVDNILDSQKIEVSDSKCSTAKSSEYDKIPSGEGAPETMSKEITSEARTTCDDSSFCSPNKDLDSSVLIDQILSRECLQQCMEVEELETHKFPEMNGNILCQNENELHSEMEHLLHTEMCSTYDDSEQSMQLRNSEDVGNQNALGIKTSMNVVPFSEEWLAAIEAAGEEILTMKTGAVQNSPPDKSQPEPGPWSPVKRKNNQGIGPFDCTKCTNTSQVHESC